MEQNSQTEHYASDRNGNAARIQDGSFVIGADDPILITGAAGFIGSRLVDCLLDLGFRNLICCVRASSGVERLEEIANRRGEGARITMIRGNLLSREDCNLMVRNVAVVYHLAAGRGEKFYPDAFLNSVVTTRNLIEACGQHTNLKRFVNISSFSVYSNTNKPDGTTLDETCPIEDKPADRGEAYCFAKVKQDEIVKEYCERFGIPYTIVRPGFVYGPGNRGISGRVGIGTFGFFLHLGGSNTIPLTYVDNCAEAIALAGLTPGIDGEAFNVVDDDLPSSRKFLRLYKKNVKRFHSVYVPHAVSYSLCYLWEKYSDWSEGQLLPAFNRRKWNAYWKKTTYTNQKLKTRLGWTPKVPAAEAYRRYFESCRAGTHHA